MPMLDSIAALGDNPYFGAGFGLFGIGVGTAVLRRGLIYGTILFRRQFMLSLEVNSNDKSYFWLLQWITARTSHSTQHLSVETGFHQSESGKVSTKFAFVPSPGEHFFRHDGRWIKVERNRQTQAVNLSKGVPFESVTMTTVGRRREFFANILEEAQQLGLRELEGRTVIYSAVGSEWRPFGYPRKKRPLSSVVLDKGAGESLLKDVQDFVSSSQWYADRGIPFRRGYLLYGPPGTGKSSFIMALAGQLDYSISMLSLSEQTLTDDRLQHLLNVAPLQSILLLEDIDAAFVSREQTPLSQTAYAGLNRISFSGLLNALDGVASADGRLLFMTTNYRKRLDPSLIRPGRVDVEQKIDFCSDYQLVQLFRRFYPNAGPAEADLFLSRMKQLATKEQIGFSAADIQGYFLLWKEQPQSAVNNVSFQHFRRAKPLVKSAEMH